MYKFASNIVSQSLISPTAPIEAEAIFVSSNFGIEKSHYQVKIHIAVCLGTLIIRSYYQDRSKFSTNGYIIYNS